MVTDTVRTTGRHFEMPDLQHTLVAFPRALAVRARSRFTERRSSTEVRKLALGLEQLNNNNNSNNNNLHWLGEPRHCRKATARTMLARGTASSDTECAMT